jgi:hypothetical protein
MCHLLSPNELLFVQFSAHLVLEGYRSRVIKSFVRRGRLTRKV